MELAKAIGSTAVVLGVVVAAGFAVGEDQVPAPTVKQASQIRLDEREAARRAALADQQRRKDDFERACNKPLKTSMDFDLCRGAYRRLSLEKSL